LYLAKSLCRRAVDVTLIDRRNVHQFQPLLYQVATGGLSPGDIASPLRGVLRRCRNIRVLLGEVTDFDVAGRRVLLRDGEVAYDYLVLAAGCGNFYFGHPEWAAAAPGLKSLEDALEIRRRILLAFEAAEREEDPALRAQWLTLVVVGGGPTGVELAGAIAELARHTLRRDFRRIDPSEARIILVEAAGRVLSQLHESVSEPARRSLGRLGVEVRTGCMVTGIDAESVMVKEGERDTLLPTRTALWAAGVAPSPLGRKLAERIGAATDKAGRVSVADDLSLAGRPEVHVIGDLARLEDAGGRLLPGVAPVAMQQGRHAARVLMAKIAGQPSPPFRYRDKGELAVIGRHAAVVRLRGKTISGYPAWWLWILVHIWYLIEFDNKLLVMLQWSIHYVTRKRGARIIGENIPGRDPVANP
jgi:NADH dehydrogenase